jgi:hypothetical protein
VRNRFGPAFSDQALSEFYPASSEAGSSAKIMASVRPVRRGVDFERALPWRTILSTRIQTISSRGRLAMAGLLLEISASLMPASPGYLRPHASSHGRSQEHSLDDLR